MEGLPPIGSYVSYREAIAFVGLIVEEQPIFVVVAWGDGEGEGPCLERHPRRYRVIAHPSDAPAQQ